MPGRTLFIASAAVLALCLSPALPVGAEPFDSGPGQFYVHDASSNWQDVLGCTDEEWVVIEPRLDKVLALRAQPPGDVVQHHHMLHHLLKHDARSDLIQNELQELREARAEADLTLAQSEADLRQILTIRQEATLVASGVLE
jgi:hypothetical protein